MIVFMENILLKIVKIGIILILITPFIIGQFGLTLSAYPKAVFFRSVVEIVFVLYLILIYSDRKYLPKITPVALAVFLFGAAILLTGLTGINFSRSFYGDPERGEGIILCLHFLAFFTMLIGVYKTREEWLNILKITVLVSAGSSLAAVLQKFNMVKFYGVSLPDRVSGTLSNPDFFAPYILMNIYLALFLFFCEKSKGIKVAWMAIALLNCLTLVWSGTRGAWVGFFFGLLVLIPVFIWKYFKHGFKQRLWYLGVMALVLLIFMSVITMPEQFNLGKNTYLQRFYSMFEFSLGSRGDIWKLGIDAFKMRPLLGWGWESFDYVYEKFYKSSFLETIDERLYFDHPHNKFVDLLSSTGIIGFTAYLLIFIAAIYQIFKRNLNWAGYNNNNKVIFSFVILAFLTAYFVQNIFFFDTICPYLVFFTVLGFISVNFPAYLRLNFPPAVKFFFIRYSKTLIIIAIFASFIAAIFCLYVVNYKPTSAAIIFPKNVKFESTDPLKAISAYLVSLDKHTIYDRDFRLIIAERIIYLVESRIMDDTSKKMVSILVYLEPALQNDSKIIDRRLGDTYEYIARIDELKYLAFGDKNSLSDMGEVLNQAINFNNQRPSFYYMQAQLEALKGNFSKTEEILTSMRSLYPAGLNYDPEFYKKKGVVYLRIDDKKKAIENFERAMQINYSYKKATGNYILRGGASFYESVAIMYYRDLKDLKNCERVYNMAIELYPEYKNILTQRFKLLTKEK
jgi:O-antigen ligase